MWKLAWRNIWRNRTRTVILLTAIALPYAMMIVSFGIIADFLGKMEDRAAESAGGNVLVHGEGYWNAKSNDIVIEEADEIGERIAVADGVGTAIPRVMISGMLTTSRATAGGQVTGIVKRKQARIRDFSKHLVAGSFLSDEHERPLVLGSGLVETLEVELGDKVVVTASDVDGEMTRALFRLRGIVETGSEQMDEMLAYTTLEAAQEAIGMGDRVHQIGLLGKEGIGAAGMAQAVEEKLGGRAEQLEVLTWREAMPEMVSYLAMENASMQIMLVIVFIIVAFVIANTFLMSVMERVREFGLFSALGLDDWRIAKLVFVETLLLTAVAVVIGFVIGLSGHFAIAHYGIDVTELFGGEMELSGIALTDMVMRSQMTPIRWLYGTVGVVALVFVSAAYPAWRATRLAPSKAMEFYE
jgi:ABC-type lipoprotein release transport system permease subunit